LNPVIKANTINLRGAGKRADWGHEYATLLKSEGILRHQPALSNQAHYLRWTMAET
jgi:hypothetical protein